MGAYFTRPTSIVINLKDEEKAQKFLENIHFPVSPSSQEFSNIKTHYDQDTHTLNTSFNLFGVIRMDISAKIEHGRLHISNSPWKESPIIDTQKNSANHLFLAMNSSEANEILPQLDSIARKNYASSAEISKGDQLMA